jgi:hypothetical protein
MQRFHETLSKELVSFPQGIKMYRGNKLFDINTNDWFFPTLSRNEWEPHSFQVLDAFLKPESCYIDIGSWNGVLGTKCVFNEF